MLIYLMRCGCSLQKQDFPRSGKVLGIPAPHPEHCRQRGCRWRERKHPAEAGSSGPRSRTKHILPTKYIVQKRANLHSTPDAMSQTCFFSCLSSHLLIITYYCSASSICGVKHQHPAENRTEENKIGLQEKNKINIG